MSTFWAIFYLRAGSWSKSLSKKASFYDFSHKKSSKNDNFFINCCKIGNVHKNNIEKTPKKSSILLCFNPFFTVFQSIFTVFQPILRLFFDEKQCKIGKYRLIFYRENHTKFWSKSSKLVKIAKSVKIGQNGKMTKITKTVKTVKNPKCV